MKIVWKMGVAAVLMLAGGMVSGRAEEDVFELGDVLVRATALPPVPSVTVLTPADWERTGANTVDEALQGLPGVAIQSAGKNNREVTMRGFSQREVKVLVDGIPLAETYAQTVDLGQMPIQGIAEIRVLRGLPSALYGPNCMGGVINIITRQGGAEPHAAVEVKGSDYSTFHAAAQAGGSSGPVNYFGAYSRQSSDGFPVSGRLESDDPDMGVKSPYGEDGGVRENSDYERHNAVAKAGYETDTGQVFLSFQGQKNEGGIPIERRRYWRYDEWEQGHLHLVGEQQAGPVRLRAQGFYFRHDDTISDDAARTKALGGRTWFDSSEYSDYSVGGLTRADWDMNEHAILRGQASYQFDQNRQRELNTYDAQGKIPRPGWSDWKTYETALWSLALEQETKINRLTTLAGVSCDLLDPVRSAELETGDSESAWNPQLGAQFALTDDLTLSAGIGQKTRFPTMKEWYSKNGGGNPELTEEKTWSTEAGLQARPVVGEMPVQLDLSVYHNETKDRIQQVEQPDGLTRNENVGRAVMQGLELQGEVALATNLTIGAGYALQDAWNEDLDRRIELVPVHQFEASLRWALLRNIAFYTGASYATGARQYLFDSKKKPYTRDLPEAVLWNLGAEYKPLAWLALSLTVDNLLDENYDLGSGPMPGRQVWAGCRVEW